MLSKELISGIQKIDNMNDWRDLRELVITQQTRIQIMAGFSFRVGEKVSFVSSRTGQPVYGTVDRINRKTISLNCGDKGKWKVTPTMLTKVGK